MKKTRGPVYGSPDFQTRITASMALWITAKGPLLTAQQPGMHSS
jgi:hypothetical protein